MATYQVAHLDQIEEMNDGRCPYRPVRHHFGITTFGATTWTGAKAGDRLLNEHDEQDEFDEMYVVLSGSARFELAGDSVEATTGTFVHVPPGVMRTAFANEAGTTILAVGGGRRGEPYMPGGWEIWSMLRPAFEAGRHDEVIERAYAYLDSGPAYPELLYNLACAEALTGRADDALAHLRWALELAPGLRRWVGEDEDLASLHEHPGFAEIAGG